MNMPPNFRPTRTRHWLIAFAIILAVIQYIDRVCISQAMPEIARDLQLTDAQKGAVFSLIEFFIDHDQIV